MAVAAEIKTALPQVAARVVATVVTQLARILEQAQADKGLLVAKAVPRPMWVQVAVALVLLAKQVMLLEQVALVLVVLAWQYLRWQPQQARVCRAFMLVVAAEAPTTAALALPLVELVAQAVAVLEQLTQQTLRRVSPILALAAALVEVRMSVLDKAELAVQEL